MYNVYISSIKWNIKVTRKTEMITNWRGARWLRNKFFMSASWDMYGEQYGESAWWCWGVQGYETQPLLRSCRLSSHATRSLPHCVKRPHIRVTVAWNASRLQHNSNMRCKIEVTFRVSSPKLNHFWQNVYQFMLNKKC